MDVIYRLTSNVYPLFEDLSSKKYTISAMRKPENLSPGESISRIDRQSRSKCFAVAHLLNLESPIHIS